MHFTGAKMLHSEGEAKHANLIGLEKSLSDTCYIIVYGGGMACQLSAAENRLCDFR